MYMDVIKEHEMYEEARKEARHNDVEGMYLSIEYPPHIL